MANQQKPGVLILTPFYRPNIGGVESYLNDLAEYLAEGGYPVYVLTYQPLTTKAKGLPLEKTNGVTIRRISWFGHNLFHKLEPYPILEFIYMTPYLFIYTFFYVLKNIRKIDIIHAQGLNAAFIGIFVSKVLRKKPIMSTCAIYNFQPESMFSKIVRWTLNGFDKILPLTNFSKKELVRIGLPPDKITPYYLWLDPNVYKPLDKATAKENIGMKDKFIVLFVGRFIKIKGVETLIEVAKRTDKKIHFVFIGDNSPLYSTVKSASAENPNIVNIEGIRGIQLIPYYQAADIFIIPSQYDEAFGKVIIEALACGTPVIGANRGSIPDIIHNSVGRIVEPAVADIQKEIEYLYRNPEILKSMTDKSRDFALNNYTKKNARIIEESYYEGAIPH